MRVHYSRIAALILGAWICGSLFMAFVATQNFERAKEVLSAPPPEVERIIQTVGSENSRLFLRHLVGEQNRSFFSSWELAQFAIGALLTGVLFIDANNRKLAAFSAAMLLMTAFAHFIMTPELIWLGRGIEFAPAGAMLRERDQFSKLHIMYGVMEAVKVLLGVVLAGLLFTMRRQHGRQKDQIDLFDVTPTQSYKS